MIVMVFFLVALDADLYHLFEDGGVFPADRREAGGRVQDGDGLNRLETNADPGDVASRRDVKLYETLDDLIVGHWRPLVRFWQRAIGRMQEDGILEQVQLELARLEKGREHP